jgi:hypothetical protein
MIIFVKIVEKSSFIRHKLFAPDFLSFFYVVWFVQTVPKADRKKKGHGTASLITFMAWWQDSSELLAKRSELLE